MSSHVQSNLYIFTNMFVPEGLVTTTDVPVSMFYNTISERARVSNLWAGKMQTDRFCQGGILFWLRGIGILPEIASIKNEDHDRKSI